MHTIATVWKCLRTAATNRLAAVVVFISWLAPVAITFATDYSLNYSTQFLTYLSETNVPGSLISVGTHRMHIFCQGKGDSTVVVDTGLGAISLEWSHIQKAIAKHTRICLYDRAGYGHSEPGPLPRTSSYIVDELYKLLTQAKIKGPYILVGHSFGGYTMQLFASRYPQLTAGVVLVDSSHMNQYSRFFAPPINVKTAPTNNLGRLSIVSFAMPSLHPNLPEDVRDEVMMLMLRQPMRYAMAYEFYNFRQSANEVKHGGKFPDIPLIVLTRGKRVYPESQKGDLMKELWMQLQSELAELSHYSAHIIAKKSGHYIHLDQPQLVIDAILMIVDVVEKQPSQKSDTVKIALVLESTSYDFTDAIWRSNNL